MASGLGLTKLWEISTSSGAKNQSQYHACVIKYYRQCKHTSCEDNNSTNTFEESQGNLNIYSHFVICI